MPYTQTCAAVEKSKLLVNRFEFSLMRLMPEVSTNNRFSGKTSKGTAMVKKFIEKRRRGFFGYVMLALFWLANGLMVLWLLSTMVGWGQMNMHTMNEAQKTGAGLGMAMGLGLIFFVWAAVGIITGLLAFMTRGPKEIIEIDT